MRQYNDYDEAPEDAELEEVDAIIETHWGRSFLWVIYIATSPLRIAGRIFVKMIAISVGKGGSIPPERMN